MNENKKGVRAPIRTVKAKNPVAKNANKAIGGGAAGAHKDKKKAVKQGDTKHKKKDYAESLEQALKTKLAEGDDSWKNLGKTPRELGEADAWYHRSFVRQVQYYGFEIGTPEFKEYAAGFHSGANDGGKDYGHAPKQRHTGGPGVRQNEAMNGITGPGMMLDPASEAEGDAEGLPHLTPELAQHIADQIDSDGAQAIVKSVEWGDGAADELIELIKDALLKIAGTDENGDLGEPRGMSPVSNIMPTETISNHQQRSAEADKKFAEREAARKKNPGAASGDRIKELEKRYPKEGWTHDSLADRLFEHERTYEEKLENMLKNQTKK